MINTLNEILSKYELKITAIKNDLAQIKSKIDRLSFLRVALLVVEIIAIVFFVRASSDLAISLGIIGLLLPIAAFVIVVKKQQRIIKNESYLKYLLWVYENELNVCSGKENGYDHGERYENEQHFYTADLDIFGKASLFSLTNRCSTANGEDLLSAHLSSPSTLPIILERQKAIQEIAENIADTFEFRANLKGHDAHKIDQIKNKLQNHLVQQLKFVQKSWLNLYVKVLPWLIPVLFVLASLFGGRWWSVLTLIALVNAALTFYHMKKINLVYYGFSGGAKLLEDYATAIKWTEDRNWKSSYIQNLFCSGNKVSDQLNQLAKIIQAFDARLNILLSTVLNFGLLWDLKCCIKLANWLNSSATNVENGLTRIGHFEKLISIATLSHNHPSWVFPKIEAQFSFDAQAMGHPLISEKKCVMNTYHLMEKPTVDIVTGSNMAGKSTFLRTLGINMVLAYAGAPVCAKEMKLSIFKVFTYMRIKDSLNESTSTFKAELNRLKMILTNIAQHADALVLIDEMLRGTNSKDKFLGSKVFIEKLLQVGTPALFATHDLQLSELEEVYPDTLRNFHFDIQLSGGEMEFDYLIKSGPCKTFNAAVLLKEIGLTIV